MKIWLKIFLVLFLFKGALKAQMPTCPSPYVYMDGGSFIKYYDPGQPLSATNPGTINIPVTGSGLALMPNINGGTLTPTFYTTLNGNYWYWNGMTWINTGHSTGNGAALNIAGCNGTIYNLVGGTGQVYAYNGTGNGTLLTTIPGFNGGGPYDLVTDCNCNFYALNTTMPNQALTMYNPSGNIICSYSLSGMPNTSGGGGFAIIGNMIYVKNSISNGFFAGTISGSAVTFTQMTGFSATSANDFASCPVCNATSSLTGVSITPGGILDCVTTTVNLAVSSTITPLNYAWSGPGIIGSSTGSQVTANGAGTYTCVVSTTACPPEQATLTSIVVSNSTNVLAAITPTGNVCMSGTSPVTLVVVHSSTTNAVSWAGPGIMSGMGTATITTNSPGNFTVTVTDVFSNCTSTDVVSVMQSPTVNVMLSTTSICAQPFNGSPASLTMTPGGASSYSMLTSANFSISATGTLINCVPKPPFPGVNSLATATLIGNNSFCVDSITTTFMIIANPTVLVTPPTPSICPNSLQSFLASGANSYSWSGSSLNLYSGGSVTANTNASSVYSVFGTGQGCNSATQNATLVILPLPTLAINPPAATICLGSTVGLTANGTATSYSWTPFTTLSSPSSSYVIAIPNQSQIYTVVGSLNSCTVVATTTITTMQPPVVSMALSSPSLCAFNYNNSVNSLIVQPTGAMNYTLLAGPNYSVAFPNGPGMVITPTGTPAPGITIATTTLLASSGVCKVSTTHTFAIISNPILGISPPSASICPGNSQLFSASGAATYTWAANPGLTLISPNSVIVTPPMTSFYSVVGSSLGCHSDLRNAVVVVLPTPTVMATPGYFTVCAGSPVTLNAIGSGLTYSWFPTGLPGSNTGTSIVVSPTLTTTYTVIAAIESCTNSAVSTVSAIPVPAIYVSASKPIVCRGMSTNLSASGAWAYQWSPAATLNHPGGHLVMASPNANTIYTVQGFNGLCTGSGTVEVKTVAWPQMELLADVNTVCRGSTLTLQALGAQSYTWLPPEGIVPGSGGAQVTLKPKASTNYTVIGVNSSGTVSCPQLMSYSVIVLEPPVPGVSGSVAICPGQKTTLSASGGNSYSWSPPAGLNSTEGQGVVANPTASTVYTVEVSYGTYCGATSTVLVEVSPRPSVFAGRDTSYDANEVIFIRASGTGSLTWISGEGILCNECPQTQVYPTQNSCYVVEAINEYGCSVKDQVCLTVTRDLNIYIPNSFTPNRDGNNDEFLVFGEHMSNLKLEVFDRWGHLIFESNDPAKGWDGTLNGSDCMAGIYIYKASYKSLNGKFFSKVGDINLIR